MKKLLALFVACILILDGGSAFAEEKIVLRVARTIDPDSHYRTDLEHLGKLLQ